MSPFNLRFFEKKSDVEQATEQLSEKPKSKSFFASRNSKTSHASDAQRYKEQAITDHLSSYARVPVSTIFTTLHPEWNPHGLTEQEAEIARHKHGRNVPSEKRGLRPLFLLIDAFVNPFNFLLIILGSISIGTGDHATFIVMMLMVVLSTGLRFWQELKSLSKAHALLDSVTSRVRVLRSSSVRGSPPSSSEEVEIDKVKVVPGDVLSITSGDVFPGDCVVLTASTLTISQASLTGEILPVDKYPRISPLSPEDDQNYLFQLLDNTNVCLAGTSVTTGSGTAIVVSTGGKTYMASIAKDLEMKRPPNAMQLGIRRVSFILTAFMLVMAPIVLIIQGVLSKNWKDALLFACAVAVGITPEMLPMIVASNLALSAIRVARKEAIVKRFDAIQNLGAVSVLCSDKTGTLTVDSVRVSVSTTEDGTPSAITGRLAYLNAMLQTGTRSPIDGAIIEYGTAESDNAGSKDHDWIKLGEIPFDSTRRLLSVLLARYVPEKNAADYSQDALFVTKGAAEEVLDSCTRVYDHSRHQPSTNKEIWASSELVNSKLVKALTDETKKQILETAKRLNNDGLRLVAVAFKPMLVKRNELDSSEVLLDPQDEEDMVFVGFLGFLDPPKEDAAEAIERLKNINVQVKILTGDSPLVAVKVARDLGLMAPRRFAALSDKASSQGRVPSSSSSDRERSENDNEISYLPVLTPATATPSAPVVEQGDARIDMASEEEEDDLVVTGAQLAALAHDVEAMRQVVDRAIIFAKLSPYQKLEVVQLLRNKGARAVAFLGDGVNDALAIRGADVGISVDSATEIAKEAADVILLRKELSVVVDAVREGRITFLNTVKYVKMAASSNFGNVFSIMAASAWLPYEPMKPLQLLVQNLLYDLSQGSIPWDNVDEDLILTPKTWNSKSLIAFMLMIGPISSPFDITTYAINWFYYGIRTSDSPLVGRAQAHWLTEGFLTQLLVIHILRTPKIPFIQSRASTIVTLVTAAVGCVVIAIPWIPFARTALHLVKPDPRFYGFLVGIIVTYAHLAQVGKMVYLRIFGKDNWL